MASFTTRRIANSLTWTLSITTRSRTIGFSYIQSEHNSSPRQHLTAAPSTRPFSTILARSQQAAAQTPAPSTTTTTPPATRPPPTRATFGQARTSFTPHEPPPQTARTAAAHPAQEPIREYSHGLSDALPGSAPGTLEEVDWTRSFHGLSSEAFSAETAAVLMQPIKEDDIEVKPDGIIYLPEIKYRRILNRAFGPGGWGLAPRGETIVTSKSVTREYALLAHGRLVSLARGEQDYFDPEGIPTATEGCKSNALMRCCKDLGVASELWDPRFVRAFLKNCAKEVWVEHAVTKRKKKVVMRKDDEVRYPFKETRAM